jgi:hypothetical protein
VTSQRRCEQATTWNDVSALVPRSQKGKGESAGTDACAFKLPQPLRFGQPPGRNCSCNCLYTGSRPPPLRNAARGCSTSGAFATPCSAQLARYEVQVTLKGRSLEPKNSTSALVDDAATQHRLSAAVGDSTIFVSPTESHGRKWAAEAVAGVFRFKIGGFYRC